MASRFLAVLPKFQAFAEGEMLDAVEITSPGTRVDLPGGGWEYGDGASITTVGRIGPLSKSSIEVLQADRLEYAGLEELRVPKDTAVSGEDAVAVTSARHGGTRQYTVEAVVPLKSHDVQRTVILKAVA